MITKDRLEELIKEEKGCYILANAYTIGYIHLNKKYEPKIEPIEDGYCLWVFTSNEFDFRDCIDDYKLFETKEDARWELEMTATRTETLKLPNFEDVFKQDRCLDCYTKEFAIVKTDIVIGICLFGVDFTNKVVEVSVGADKMFTGKLTKENYINACKLCLRLFKGEEV